MKTIGITFLTLIFALTGFAQGTKKSTDVPLTESQKTTINLQLALQANAELRKQLAQERAKSADLERQVANFELKSEMANVQAINANGDSVLEKVATDLGVSLKDHDFNLQEMKFTPKPLAEVKQPKPPIVTVITPAKP